MFESATSPEATTHASTMVRALNNRRAIVGVDRLDYTKGLPLRFQAFAQFHLGLHAQALQSLRDPAIRRTTLAADAKLLELRVLKAMGDKRFVEAARRARLDLEPFRVYPAVLKLLDG